MQPIKVEWNGVKAEIAEAPSTDKERSVPWHELRLTIDEYDPEARTTIERTFTAQAYTLDSLISVLTTLRTLYRSSDRH